MKKKLLLQILVVLLLMAPGVVFCQTDTTKKAAASSPALALKVDSTTVKTDTVQVVVTAKDCFTEWYEKFRQRGALPVKDGTQPVIITLKSESGAVCLVGKIDVLGGKIKPPLLVQSEGGEYKPFNTVGKKLDPAFESSMLPDQLYSITDGMSIVFRTNNQEYGRLIFYTFVAKGKNEHKAAPTPDELMK